MGIHFSLAHLTILSSPPPELAYIAADAGYDFVSPRIILSSMPNETGINYELATNPPLYRETKKALSDTGIKIHDIELVRITDTFDPKTLIPSFEIAAELGVAHILTSVWTSNHALATDRFAQLCDVALPYNLNISLEFVTWADLNNLQQALALLRAVNRSNAYLMVDLLHAQRSRVTPAELAAVPAQLFSFIHLCDAPAHIPPTKEELIYTGREARLYVGEGGLDILGYLNAMPAVPYSLEIPNLHRVQQLGNPGHAKRCLETAKDFFAAHSLSSPGRSTAPTIPNPY